MPKRHNNQTELSRVKDFVRNDVIPSHDPQIRHDGPDSLLRSGGVGAAVV